MNYLKMNTGTAGLVDMKLTCGISYPGMSHKRRKGNKVHNSFFFFFPGIVSLFLVFPSQDTNFEFYFITIWTEQSTLEPMMKKNLQQEHMI